MNEYEHEREHERKAGLTSATVIVMSAVLAFCIFLSVIAFEAIGKRAWGVHAQANPTVIVVTPTPQKTIVPIVTLTPSATPTKVIPPIITPVPVKPKVRIYLPLMSKSHGVVKL